MLGKIKVLEVTIRLKVYSGTLIVGESLRGPRDVFDEGPNSANVLVSIVKDFS